MASEWSWLSLTVLGSVTLMLGALYHMTYPYLFQWRDTLLAHRAAMQQLASLREERESLSDQADWSREDGEIARAGAIAAECNRVTTEMEGIRQQFQLE
jgi:hypothetical protein